MYAIFACAPLGTANAATPTPVVADQYESALTAFDAGEFAQALVLAKTAGSTGNADAQVLAGYILEHGKTGAPNKRDAVSWYLKAAALGNTDAMVALGTIAIEQEGGLSYADAVKWLENAANTGRTDAMRALGDIYIKGKGTAPNAENAKKWLTRAASYGDILAERRLGDWYFDSQPQEALKWYESAALHGDHQSAYIAGIMYAENFEIKPNTIKKAALLKQAANAGIPAAMADYGLLVYQGNGAPRSAAKAADWFKKAAIAGDAEGRFLYAYTLAKGDGIPQNFEDAYYWLLRADQDQGKSGVPEYDKDRQTLREGLEKTVNADILARARTRAASDRLLGQ